MAHLDVKGGSTRTKTSSVDPAMIGVFCRPGEERWASEFFELFKTPWEPYKTGRTYSVVISTDANIQHVRAQLLVLYSSAAGTLAAEKSSPLDGAYLDYQEFEVPIYGKLLTFTAAQRPVVMVHGSGAAVVEVPHPYMKVIRAGFDLFEEVAVLLSSGQPTCNAATPTLDLHIAMLRRWILAAGIPVVEIPPAPANYDFVACLTHDVDFIRIRDHKLDHTTWGFIYRASVGSLLRLLKRKISWQHFWTNLKALLSLPAVYLGLCRDFWFEDFERFMALEKGLHPTFFFIPFKNRPGDKVFRKHPERRVAVYDVTEEKKLLNQLTQAGSEIGVHGIDAWHDVEKGRAEYRRIAETSGQSDLGVRVHWLCFDRVSPRVLEQAGYRFDSTFGYNDAVGYRAGTSQVFRPENVETLLELPLHIQDSALFYAGYLGLEQSGAWAHCESLLRNASAHGGVLTILWHTRSLAPERQWGDFYMRLLRELRSRPVWFASAGQVVRWFRRRRAVRFLSAEFSEGRLCLTLDSEGRDLSTSEPPLVVRIHFPLAGCPGAANCIDIPWTGESRLEVPVVAELRRA